MREKPAQTLLVVSNELAMAREAPSFALVSWATMGPKYHDGPSMDIGHSTLLLLDQTARSRTTTVMGLSKLRRSLKKRLLRRAVRKAKERVVAQNGTGPIVKTLCISMLKNEQDIVEPFLRTNRPFFDAMIVLDNGSTDLTREIAVNCARELGGIFVVDAPSNEYAQSEFLTAAFRFTQTAFFADFVCFLDADEMIAAPNRATFLHLLARAPVGTVSLHPWQTILPDPAVPVDPGSDPMTRMTLRRKKENPQYSKVILHLGGGFEGALVVEKGSHAVWSPNMADRAPLLMPDLPILHFPVRTSDQILAKGVVNWMSVIAKNPEMAKAGSDYHGMSYQAKRTYDLALRANYSISPQEVSEQAMAYAQTATGLSFHDSTEPADHQINLKRIYSTGHSADFFQTVAKSLIAAPSPRPAYKIDIPAVQQMVDTEVANAFDVQWHWDHLYLDVAPFRYLAQQYRPQSVFDIGCGKGIYVQLFKRFGVTEGFGVDGLDRSATVLDANEYATVDLQVPYRTGRQYDLVTCLEVAEHLYPESTETLFDTIAAHAKGIIVFSMAEPGQPGNGHINCKTIPEVLDLWERRGWVPDLVETLGLRAISTMSWFRRNLIVLKRGGTISADGGRDALCRIAALSHVWYGQEPGIRQTALGEHFPKHEFGYGDITGRSPPPLAPGPAPA